MLKYCKLMKFESNCVIYTVLWYFQRLLSRSLLWYFQKLKSYQGMHSTEKIQTIQHKKAGDFTTNLFVLASTNVILKNRIPFFKFWKYIIAKVEKCTTQLLESKGQKWPVSSQPLPPFPPPFPPWAWTLSHSCQQTTFHQGSRAPLTRIIMVS